MRDHSTEHARQVLAAEGFAVEDIVPHDVEKRADLRVTFGSEEYILEAKLRGPHATWGELKARAAREGAAWMSRQVTPWNALSSMVREAYEQLLATPRAPGAFCVLWAVALHRDDAFVADCLEKRLMGVEELLVVQPETLNLSTTRCYYHSSNDFERCPQLDGVVLSTHRGARLLINYFSERRKLLRRCRLHAIFESARAVVDAEVGAQRGEALMLGDDFVGPRDGKSQWQYLMEHHRIATSVMTDSQFYGLATVSVSRD